MLEAERTTYRKIAGIPGNNHAMTAKMHGDCTKCRGPDNQARDVSIRAICHNIELVVRSQAKDGRLTQDQIATLAA